MAADSPDTPERRSRRTVVVDDRSQIQLQRCKLVLMSSSKKGAEFELKGSEVTVGSGDDCDIRIEDETVSKRHFAIARDAQSFLVRDLGSTNGTFLDNARVKEAYMRPGSLLRAGEAFFRFEPVYERIEIVPSEASTFHGLIGRSYRMRQIFAVLEKVAPTEATILLQGETGTGKGAVARAIHEAGNRRDGPFVVFDCGAIAPTLVESELFGHERGAFTGAVAQRRGALEEAHNVTLFIDELSDVSLNLQPKLLRVLEDREVTRVGSNKPVKVDCRIIAATQRDLWNEVQQNAFREDLYFRLAVVTIPLPPLRERRDDIPLLIDGMLTDLASERYRHFDDLEPDLQRMLLAHEWPGNIRELRNAVERAALMQQPFVGQGKRPDDGGLPVAEDTGSLPAVFSLPFKDAKEQLVAAFEKEYLTRLLARSDNNIARAAREAGIDRKHLYTLPGKHGLAGSDES
ncbi:MAG: sigma 54-dependent Fis family transcriptional regulator [Deltaproteobacteria bacterium]|nr:sigma 54-dependent Fis family transcriptional regulator [Deltaproteobacteria bacterium]